MSQTTEHRVIADEATGEIRCTECGETQKVRGFDGDFFTFLRFDNATHEMVRIHAAKHDWKEA